MVTGDLYCLWNRVYSILHLYLKNSCAFVKTSKKGLQTNSFLFLEILKTIEKYQAKLLKEVDFTNMFGYCLIQAKVVEPIFIKRLEVSQENRLFKQI